MLVCSGFVPANEGTARRPVSRVLSAAHGFPWQRDDHSSGTRLATRLARPTRTAERECSCALRRCHPYSVLLPVGFTLPPLLPGARCALAAPFRPCPRAALRRLRGRFVFCGTFPGVAPAGRYPAPYSRGARTFLYRLARQRPSGRLATREMAAIEPPRQGAGGNRAVVR